MKGCKGVLSLIGVVMGIVIVAGSFVIVRWAVDFFNQNPVAKGGAIGAGALLLLAIIFLVGQANARNLMREGADIANQGNLHRANSHKAMSTMGGAMARMLTGKQEQPQLPPPSSPWQVQSPFPMVTDAQFEDVGNNDEPIA